MLLPTAVRRVLRELVHPCEQSYSQAKSEERCLPTGASQRETAPAKTHNASLLFIRVGMEATSSQSS